MTQYDAFGREVVTPEDDARRAVQAAASEVQRVAAGVASGEIGPAALARAEAALDAAVRPPDAGPGPGGGGPRNTPADGNTPENSLAAAQEAGDWKAVRRHNARMLAEIREHGYSPTYGSGN